MIRKMQLSTWSKLTESALGKPAWKQLNGPSPGGVGAILGISRQAVHKAVKRGDLDAVVVYEGTRLRMFMVTEDSIESFKAKRERRLAG
jgi:hypothetical protein